MIRRTFAQVKPELSRLAGASGMSVTDTRFLRVLNRAIEELMPEGDWPGVVDRYRFTAYGGEITLPGDLERITHVAIDKIPIGMRSDWYEFMAGGPGVQDGNDWLDELIDRGEACTIRDIPSAGLYLKVVGAVDERIASVRPNITLLGYGADGRWLRSASGSDYVDGMNVAINGDTSPKFIQTSEAVLGLDAVIKPVTKGYVSLYATDGTTSYHLATYAPRETAPSYRRYLVPFLNTGEASTVIARCRRRFVPIVADNDFLCITNMPALEAMILAQHKRETEDLDRYFALKGTALKLLRKEAEAYRGTAVRPAITFARGFGMGGVPHIQ